jgi:hypothetical protein
MVQIKSRLSLCDHHQFTELVHNVGLSGMFKELFVYRLTVNGLNGLNYNIHVEATPSTTSKQTTSYAKNYGLQAY